MSDLLHPHPPARIPGQGALRSATPPSGCALSLIAPVFDEVDNLAPLVERVQKALDGTAARRLAGDWELILVDDGSRDGSDRRIRSLHRAEPRVRGVYLGRNCGQTAALAAGLHVARGRTIATLDADLQNDPADLPRMLARLEAEGVDAVLGWRRKRNDSVVRRLSSRIAYRVRNALLRDAVRDTGCSLKVFRSEALRALPLYEGMHRFLGTLLLQRGYTLVQEPVAHHPRTQGASKYGISNRAWRAFKDMLAVRWMGERQLVLPISAHDPAPVPSPAADEPRPHGARDEEPARTSRR